MANDPLTFSSGCRDGTALCRVTINGDVDGAPVLDGVACLKAENGYRCGDHYLHTESPRMFYYLPGPRRGTLTMWRSAEARTSVPPQVYLPYKNPVELAPWRERLIKRIEQLAMRESNAIEQNLMLGEITGDNQYYERALVWAMTVAGDSAARHLRTIAERWPAGHSPAPLLQRADALLPKIAQLNPWGKAGAYADLAIALAKTGRINQAREIAAQAYQIANGFPSPVARADGLSRMVPILARVGHVAQALEGLAVVHAAFVVAGLPNTVSRSNVVREVFSILRDAGYLAQVEAFVKERPEYASFLADLGKEAKPSGPPAEEPNGDMGPVEIAATLAGAGYIDSAVALVEKISVNDPGTIMQTLAQIAKLIPQITEEQRLAYQVFENYRVFEYNIVQPRQAAVWAALRPILQQAGMNFPEPMLADYPAFLRGIGTVIKFRTRVQSFHAIYELWQNRPNATPRVALLLTGSFDGDPPMMDHLADPLVQSGQFRVFSRVVKDETEFHAAIAAVHAEAGAPIHTLVLAGMQWEIGKPVHMHPMAPWCAGGCFHLGDSSVADEFTISVDDFSYGDFSTFASHIDPAGQLLLDLCVGGHGGRAGKNLANAFARLVPPTFAIYSAQEDDAVRSVAVRPDRRLMVGWMRGPVYNTLGRYGVRVRKPVKEPWLKVE